MEAIYAIGAAIVVIIIQLYTYACKRYTGGKQADTTAINTYQPPLVLFSDIKLYREYTPGIKNTSIHIGQRKLLLNEIQFLTDFPAEPCLVVYAGAAPGNKTGYLSKLFPKITWLLVDPNKFEIFDSKPVYIKTPKSLKFNGGIYIINDIYTNDISRELSALSQPIYFISDIRTDTDDVNVLWNLAQQYNWVKILRPRAAMLKFRHIYYRDDLAPLAGKPYIDDIACAAKFGIDFVADAKAKRLTYFGGEIRLQPWAPALSTETRLVVTDIDSVATYDDINDAKYESAMFYYNTVERVKPHTNDNANLRIGFDHCNDCALENVIWKRYIETHGGKNTVLDYVKAVSALTHRPLLRDKHGKL